MTPDEIKNKLTSISVEIKDIQHKMFDLNDEYQNVTNGVGLVRSYLLKVLEELQFLTIDCERKLVK